jgi:type I restriction enzyme R subunit
LNIALNAAHAFALAQKVDTLAMLAAEPLARLKLITAGVEALVSPDEVRKSFPADLGVTKAYKALLPDERAAPFLKPVAIMHTLAEAVRAKLGPVDIFAIQARIAELLDEKIEGVAILAPIVTGDTAEGRVDLSGIDFDKLAKLFEVSPKVATQKLREEAEEQARQLAEENPTRVHLMERLEKLIELYNTGAIDVERLFDQLKAFIGEMTEEEHRAARLGLTGAELALYDLLTTPEPKLTDAQETEVKKVARQLLAKLTEAVASVDWLRSQETRGQVKREIKLALNDLPQDPYPDDLWNAKVDRVWEFVTQQYS